MAVDYSRYDNCGALQSGRVFVDGYLGKALSFDVDCGKQLGNSGPVSMGMGPDSFC